MPEGMEVGLLPLLRQVAEEVGCMPRFYPPWKEGGKAGSRGGREVAIAVSAGRADLT